MCTWDQNKMSIEVGTVYIVSACCNIVIFGEPGHHFMAFRAPHGFPEHSGSFRVVVTPNTNHVERGRPHEGFFHICVKCKEKQMN